MYWYILICTTMYLTIYMRKQDFVVHTVMKQCSSNLLCRTSGRMMMRISTPVMRMRNFSEQGQTQRKWRKQSVSLWMAWRQMNAVALTRCTVFLGACLSLCRRKTAVWQLEGGFLPDMDEVEQKLFTPSELLLYKHAVEYRLRAIHTIT